MNRTVPTRDMSFRAPPFVLYVVATLRSSIGVGPNQLARIMGELRHLSGVSAYFKQRKHRRFNLRYPVHVKFQRGRFAAEIEATSKNVSIGGLLLQSASEIPRHTPIKFTMTIQGGPVVRPIRVTGEGKVVRVERGSREQEFSIAVQCLSRVTQVRQSLSAAS